MGTIQFIGQIFPRAKQQHLYMHARFAEHLRDLRDFHLLGVMKPKRLELRFAEPLPREPPEVFAFFALRNEFGRSGVIHHLRQWSIGNRRGKAMTINAVAPCDGEKPRRKSAARIVLSDFPKCFQESVLRQLGSIGSIGAKLGDEREHAALVTKDKLLKTIQRTGLRLARQLLIRTG